MLGILISPIMTRLFLPEAFGASALFVSIITIFSIISCLRYEIAIMLPTKDEDAINLVALCFVITTFMTVILFLAIIFWGRQLIRIINAESIMKFSWLLPIAVFFAGTFQSLNYWNSRKKNFGQLSISQIVSSTISQPIKLVAGFSGFNGAGTLIATNLLNSFISISILIYSHLKKNFGLILKFVKIDKIIQVFKRYKKFPLFDLWGALLNSISWQLPTLMLGGFFSTKIVGYYAIASTVLGMPLNLIGGSLAQVFFQKASEIKHARADIHESVSGLLKRLLLIGLPPLLIVTISGKDLFAFIFGARWAEAGFYAQILSPYLFFYFIASPLSSIFFIMERQGTALGVHILIFISRFIAIFIGGALKNPILALILFSSTGVLVYGVVCMWNLKLARIPISLLYLTIVKNLLCFLPAGLSIILMKNQLSISPGMLLGFCLIYLTGYYLLMLKSDRELQTKIFGKPIF